METEKNLAILFVDIVDSTRLYERMGNVQATSFTQNILQKLRLIVDNNRGTVVKSLGDGLLCIFASADQAATSAQAMIDSQDSFNHKVRIGIHFGTAIQRGGDVFGDAINVAARVESLAKPGEILATEDLVQSLSLGLRSLAIKIDSTVVKGKTVPIGIFHLRPPGSLDDSVESTIIGLDLFKDSAITLHLDYMGMEFTISRMSPKLRIGRSDECEIKVASRQASREHGSIEFVRESFIISDHSSNGTYIATGDTHPILLRRDSTKLVGKGLLGIGTLPDPAVPECVIRFWSDLA
ncbi:Adenylate cyclase, class 3 [uncultured Gammaproteobacteria bacterium]